MDQTKLVNQVLIPWQDALLSPPPTYPALLTLAKRSLTARQS
jgi:hypothetical protein